MISSSGTDNAAFSKIYRIYFPKLVRFSQEYVVSTEDAENKKESLDALSERELKLKDMVGCIRLNFN